MATRVKRIMLVGWDGAPPQMIERMVEKGLLGNFARLMEQGTFIRALNPYPTITASNWTTLSTGAWPGRHGVTGFNVHHPGDPLDRIYSGFNTAECSVEHIWDAAESVGKKCILVHYETSWPPTLKRGIVVDGGGPGYSTDFHKIAPDRVFSTETYPEPVPTPPVEITQADGTCLAALRFVTASDESRAYYARWDKGGKTVTLFRDEACKEALASMEEGGWSGPVHDSFLYEGDSVDAAFQFKLLHLPDAVDDEFKLLCTSIMPTREFAYPRDIGAELVERLGPYYPHSGFECFAALGAETYLEYLDMHHAWLGGACRHLLSNNDWDLLYTQTHCHDYLHHLFMRFYDPITAGKGPWSQEVSESIMDRAYESADRMLGQVMECADDETLIAVVSDHGATTWLADVNIRQILIDRGLMVVDDDAGGVIWEKTKAVPQRACYIYVNVKGRDPQGIVEPGEEYEAVRDRIVEALYDYVEPETGKRPFSLALRREDARILGLHGPRVGCTVRPRTRAGPAHGSFRARIPRSRDYALWAGD